jgi:hypothetical protein
MTEFVLVPKEPTVEMITACIENASKEDVCLEDAVIHSYKAMLSASPTPPEAQGERVREALKEALYIVSHSSSSEEAQLRIEALIPSIEQREG